MPDPPQRLLLLDSREGFFRIKRAKFSQTTERISGCKGRQHWPEEIPRKSFLFHTIHSAAPTFGIDPARRQRVDSTYRSKQLVSQKFSSSQKLHRTGSQEIGRGLLVDKNSGQNQRRNYPDPNGVAVRDGKQDTWPIWPLGRH